MINKSTYNLLSCGALCLILLLGFLVRTYHINFPSIGYHNMKENDLLSIAQEMKRTGDFLTRRVYFLSGLEEEPMVKLFPQVPLIPYQILVSWRFLGENLWGPRLLNVIFGVLSILVIYLIGRLLFRETILSLLCAFFLSIMPLAVFFSRNIQPESPGFFFMILGNLFYLRFIRFLKKSDFFLGGVSFSIAWLYKLSFIIGVFPFLFCLPYTIFFKEKKESLRHIVVFLISYIPVLIVTLWLIQIGEWQFHPAVRINLWKIFTFSYWKEYGRPIWWYMQGENFTPVYTALTLLGIIFAILKPKELSNRFILGWALTIIPYAMIFQNLINQHNYYQMPFLILVCVSSVNAISYISEVVSIKSVSPKHFLVFLIAVVIIISSSFVYNSTSRMFGTIFYGLDVAGASLKEFTKPGERIFLLAHHQGQGIARYARRYAGWTDDLEDFKNKERSFNIRYISFYPAELALTLKINNAALFDYIQNNYHVKEVGLTEEPANIFYIILEKGEGSDQKTFLQSFNGTRQLRTIYKIPNRYIFFYSLRPSATPKGKEEVKP